MKKFLVVLFCLLPFTVLAQAPTTYFREWSKIDVAGPYDTAYSDFRYEAFIESRNQETRLDFSSGYRFTPLVSFWSGFTWISPHDGFAQTYRPWQQIIWELLDKNPIFLFQTRTCLEELKREGQPEWLLKLRERWRVTFPERWGKLTPVLYDEVFFNFNHPVWVNPGFVDQNRVFVGVDTPTWKKTFVELGYLNQYVFNQPVNTMSHVLLISFMIVLP